MGLEGLERVQVESRAEWRAWLRKNHKQTESIWLVTFKKSSGPGHLPYNDVVEEALCFGWIDSRPAKLDAERSMLLISPRKRGSAWSKLNKERIERMIAARRMTPAGLLKIEEAKRDGAWEFLDDVDTLTIPADLLSALQANPAARRNFEAFSRSAKRGLLEWIKSAKRPETRSKRIEAAVEAASKNYPANAPARIIARASK